MQIDLSKYPDRKYLKWIDQPKYTGWHFQVERLPLPESKFFNIKKYNGEVGAYESAKTYRDNYVEAAKTLGIWSDHRLGHSRIPITITLPANNRSGIVGVYRKEYPRKDRELPEVQWVANYKNSEGAQRQKGFSVRQLGERPAFYNAVQYRRDFVARVLSTVEDPITRKIIDTHIEELDSLLEYIKNILDEADLDDFVKSITDDRYSNTEKQEFLSIRVGQQLFRKKVLEYWNQSCAIKGVKILLTAAHIKPWKDANNIERIDVYNGLALSPIYDKAFDAGYISFDDNGRILLSNDIQEEAAILGIYGSEKINNLNPFHHKYLEYHRKNIFKSTNTA
jgi:hypothetical protein